MMLAIMKQPWNRSSVSLATGMVAVALLTFACGTKSGLRNDKPGTGGTAGATQTAGSGGNPGTGGAGSGGTPGTGGIAGSGGMPGTGGKGGSGGSPGTGGSTSDAGPQVACTDDSGVGLPVAARRCTQDSDCTIAIGARCCGPDQALGEAKSQVSTYASCLALPPGACSGLGCAKFIGYSTDTGRTTPMDSTSSQPIDFVSVHCLNQLCTTDVVDVQDAGRDAATVVDAAVDSIGQSCGGATCVSGQACVLFSGGPQPQCTALADGGGCPSGLVVVTSCRDYAMGGVYRQPGCTSPAPTPQCVDLADGCGDLCSCVCPTAGGCNVSPAYVSCGMP